MPGRMITSVADIVKGINAQVEEQMEDLLFALQYVGEACVKEARELPCPDIDLSQYVKDGRRIKPIPPHQEHYIDWTGNLRSSIGYIIVKDGKVWDKSVPEKVKNGNEGIQKGQAYLESLADKWGRKGAYLIVSAGMDYAEYVESRGYVVLSSAELKAPDLLRDILSKLGFTVK